MAIIPFPVGPSCFSEGWRIENASRTAGPTILGQQQFVSSPAGRWRGRMQFHCITDDDYLEVDGFLAALDGSANTFYLGPADWRGRPWNSDALTGSLITPDRVAANARAHPGYDTNPDTTGRLDFALAAPVALNATSLTIQRNKGGALKRGQYLSIGKHLHIITALAAPDPSDPATGQPVPGAVQVSIRPWTRRVFQAGSPVEFARPVGLMRLAPDAAPLLERTTSPLSDLPLEFVEAF
ncbi:hypothetical protein PUR23_19640 [Methylorubrum populi]|uniref:hypothetical protein n=1 Tax=Methylorubrum populi TaxID=223967 RepID=UPI0031F7C35A